jgi:hypothetical protein
MRGGVSRLAFLITLSIGCVGCEPPARPRQDQRRTDKRSLFGDASLVPTREGERVRRELALAGELTTSLELMALRLVPVKTTISCTNWPVGGLHIGM